MHVLDRRQVLDRGAVSHAASVNESLCLAGTYKAFHLYLDHHCPLFGADVVPVSHARLAQIRIRMHSLALYQWPGWFDGQKAARRVQTQITGSSTEHLYFNSQMQMQSPSFTAIVTETIWTEVW